MRLPNDIGLRALFPRVPSICLELSCIGRANYLGSEILGLPVHIRYNRFLFQCRNDAGEDGYLRMDIHVSIKTHSPRLSVSSDTFYDLRNAGLGPPRWFRQGNASGEYEQMRCGVLYSYVKSYVREYQGDLKAINRRLWMASNRSQSTTARLLATPHHYWEYKRLQRSLPTFTFRYTVYHQAYKKGWPLINI
ncbi:hypothetical protein EV421DRAFT_1827238 [Armillaria borealis]|uniref:Uncharacterized protein n=1 Tax=Armillaria borealis TaxID=47425 RepID=A0AA39J815_9AGAR|nr:hypothetical protein EV421DRAFT_1827238 [Armillaria borealis]